MGDAAGYVTKCSGEGIYFAAKSGRMAAEAIVQGSQQVSTCTHYMPEWLGLMCMASCSTTSRNKARGHTREPSVHLLSTGLVFAATVIQLMSCVQHLLYPVPMFC